MPRAWRGFGLESGMDIEPPYAFDHPRTKLVGLDARDGWLIIYGTRPVLRRGKRCYLIMECKPTGKGSRSGKAQRWYGVRFRYRVKKADAKTWFARFQRFPRDWSSIGRQNSPARGSPLCITDGIEGSQVVDLGMVKEIMRVMPTWQARRGLLNSLSAPLADS